MPSNIAAYLYWVQVDVAENNIEIGEAVINADPGSSGDAAVIVDAATATSATIAATSGDAAQAMDAYLYWVQADVAELNAVSGAAVVNAAPDASGDADVTIPADATSAATAGTSGDCVVIVPAAVSFDVSAQASADVAVFVAAAAQVYVSASASVAALVNLSASATTAATADASGDHLPDRVGVPPICLEITDTTPKITVREKSIRFAITEC